MDSNTVIALPTNNKPARFRKAKPATTPRTRKSTMGQKLAIVASTSIGAVGVFATALSLSDLADSIQDVAHVATWKAYALATALDANFIATEAFSLFGTAAVARATHKATTATKIVTLTMSGIANAYAMSSQATGPIMQGAMVAAGFAIPLLIALGTYTLAKAVRS